AHGAVEVQRRAAEVVDLPGVLDDRDVEAEAHDVEEVPALDRAHVDGPRVPGRHYARGGGHVLRGHVERLGEVAARPARHQPQRGVDAGAQDRVADVAPGAVAA